MEDYHSCKYWSYDYDRNECNHENSKSNRCGYGKCPLEIEKENVDETSG